MPRPIPFDVDDWLGNRHRLGRIGFCLSLPPRTLS
jgi:hypothetical protein